MLASLEARGIDLDRVAWRKVFGMVNAAPGFNALPGVINGFSDLVLEVFGERGKHARSAVGVAELPFGAPVEVEAEVALLPAANDVRSRAGGAAAARGRCTAGDLGVRTTPCGLRRHQPPDAAGRGSPAGDQGALEPVLDFHRRHAAGDPARGAHEPRQAPSDNSLELGEYRVPVSVLPIGFLALRHVPVLADGRAFPHARGGPRGTTISRRAWHGTSFVSTRRSLTCSTPATCVPSRRCPASRCCSGSGACSSAPASGLVFSTLVIRGITASVDDRPIFLCLRVGDPGHRGLRRQSDPSGRYAASWRPSMANASRSGRSDWRWRSWYSR